MEYLFIILTVIAIGVAAGSLTQFLYFAIGEPGNDDDVVTGRIFSIYGLWLWERYVKAENRRQKIATDHAMQFMDSDRHLKRKLASQINWYKAMGICPVCFNFYVTAAVSLPALSIMGLNLFLGILVLGFSNLTLHILTR